MSKTPAFAPTPAYNRWFERARLCSALMHGTAGMRALETTGLPWYSNEDWKDYLVRLNASFLTPYFSEAVGDIAGRMFSEPLVLSQDTPESVSDLWDDVDLADTQADVFFHRVETDAIESGGSYVLVDMPPASPGRTRTTADEARDGVRPFLKHLELCGVIEPPLVVYESGVPRIQRMRVKFTSEESDGSEFGTKAVERVVIYRRGDPMLPDPGPNVMPTDPANAHFASFETREKVKAENGEESELVRLDLSGYFLPPRKATPDQRRRFVNLPIVLFATKLGAGPFIVDPPLRDSLAELCLQHWQKSSRLDTIIDAVNMPIMTGQMTRAEFEGVNAAAIVIDETKLQNQRELRLGPFSLLFTGGQERDIKWLEHNGTSISAGQDDRERLEAKIARAAADPFQRRPTGAETATAQILADKKPRTQAQLFAMMAQSSIDECLEWMSAWLNETAVGSAKFGDDAMDKLGGQDDFGHVLTMWEKGQITDEQLIAEAKRRGILDPTLERAEPITTVPTQPTPVPEPMPQEGAA